VAGVLADAGRGGGARRDGIRQMGAGARPASAPWARSRQDSENEE